MLVKYSLTTYNTQKNIHLPKNKYSQFDGLTMTQLKFYAFGKLGACLATKELFYQDRDIGSLEFISD